MRYKNYQTVENQKGNRKWCEAGNTPENAYHESIFDFSSTNPDDEKTTRHGDFWLDIDNKIIQEAIKATQISGQFLSGIGVDLNHCELYATGSKGFHIKIPLKLFDGIAHTQLDKIFKYIAERFEQESGVVLDMNLYKSGMGQTLRIPNKQRANGKFKVQMSWAELEDMTPETYSALCSSPRPLIAPQEPETSNKYLSRLFSEAAAEIRDARIIATLEPVELDGVEIPKCMEQLARGENLKDGVEFNSAKQTMARFLIATGRDETDQLAVDFCENFESQRHPTPAARLAELRAAINAMRGSSFGCGYARAVLEASPCKGCPLLPKDTFKTENLRLIRTVSTAKAHIKKLKDRIKLTTGDIQNELRSALVKCLAKSTPAKRSVERAIREAVSVGCDEVMARETIEADFAARFGQCLARNTISRFNGERVNVDGMTPDEIAGLIVGRMDLESLFKSKIGATKQHGDWDNRVWGTVKVEPIEVKPLNFALNLPMGAGKSTSVAIVWQKVQQLMHDKFVAYLSTLPRRLTIRLNEVDCKANLTVLAHRTSLITGLADSFNVANYQGIDEKFKFHGSFASCVDSLNQFHVKNDLLAVDEVVQVKEHIATSDTIGTAGKVSRSELFESFIKHYESATYTFLMDANLNDETLDLFSNRETILLEMSPTPHIANHKILSSHDESRHKILSLLKAGRKGVAGCTSEVEALMTFKWIMRQPDLKKRVLLLTGRNKGNSRQAAFLANPTTESEKYDLIIHSPVIGSGVSLTNPNLTFSVLMNTCVVPAGEALQMLGRNRCAEDIFISFGKHSNVDRVTDFEVFIEAEKERIADETKRNLENNGMRFEGDFLGCIKVSKLTSIQARVMAARNSDMNDYENNLILLGMVQGRSFESSEGIAVEFKIKSLKDETKAEIVDAVFKAEVVDAEQAKALQELPATTQDQSNAVDRYHTVEMVGTDNITPDDVANFKDGYMSRVLKFEMLQKDDDELKADDVANRKTLNKIGSKLKEKQIFNEVRELLEVGEVTAKEALNACLILKKHHRELSHIGNFNKAKSEFSQPVRTLGAFLKRYGFRLQEFNANSVRFYQLKIDEVVSLYANNRAGSSSADK